MPKIRSRTKVTVNNNELIRIVQHHFGEETIIDNIQELAEGYYSIAYAIELKNKDYNIVIKFAPPSMKYQLIYEQKGIETEVAFIRLLEKETLRNKIPYPELLFEDIEGKVIGRPYFIMKKFEGLIWKEIRKKLTKEEIESFREQLGMIQKNINNIKGKRFGSLIPYSEFPIDRDTWGETVLEMFRNLLRDSKRFKTGLTRKGEKIITTLKKHLSSLNQISEPCLIHWDLWEGNATVIKNNGKWEIEGIFDFERALWGDSQIEILFRNVWRHESFLNGYGEDLFKKQGAEIRERIYSLYLMMIFIIESSARNYQFHLKFFFKYVGWRYFRKRLKELDKNQFA